MWETWHYNLLESGECWLNLLKMACPAGWELLVSEDNGQVLSMLGGSRIIYARVSFFDCADRETLHSTFKSKACSATTIVSESTNTFVFNHLRWYADSYVTSGEEKYQSFYYACLGKQFVTIALVTGSPQSVLLFFTEAKRLIKAIDCSAMSQDNRFLVNGSVYSASAPAAYNLSRASTDDRLVFVGEKGYAIVNVELPEEPLRLRIDHCVMLCDICVAGCKVVKAGAGIDGGREWAAYNVECQGEVVGTCIYVRVFFKEDILGLFLYERGSSSLEMYKLFQLDREVGLSAQE